MNGNMLTVPNLASLLRLLALKKQHPYLMLAPRSTASSLRSLSSSPSQESITRASSELVDLIVVPWIDTAKW